MSAPPRAEHGPQSARGHGPESAPEGAPEPAGRPPAGRALEPYRQDLPYTYAFGHFAAMEALRHRPAQVTAVLVHRDLPERWRHELLAAAERAGARVLHDDATVARLRRNEQVRCLAVVGKVHDAIDGANDHVVLAAPSHAGNVGSALRSLAAFGFEDVALIAPRVDPWSPHVARASVGMRFAVRCAAFRTAEDYLASFPRHSVYAFDASGETELSHARFRSPFALWFGPEWPGAGTTAAVPAAATVRIASRPLVESLNLAVAVSLATYRASRS